MRTEFLIILVIVNTVLLVVGEELLVGGNGGYHTLCLGIIGTAKALDELEEGDGVLCSMDGQKRVSGINLILEGSGALVVNQKKCTAISISYLSNLAEAFSCCFFQR